MELYHIIVLTVGRAREVHTRYYVTGEDEGDVVRPASVYLEKEEDDGRRRLTLSLLFLFEAFITTNEHDWWRCP